MISPEELTERLAAAPALLEELARDAPWPSGHGDPEEHDAQIRPLRSRMTALLGELAALENLQRAASRDEDQAKFDRLEADLQRLRTDQQVLTDQIEPLAAIPIGLDDLRAAEIVNRQREELGGKSYAEAWFGEPVTAQDMAGAR